MNSIAGENPQARGVDLYASKAFAGSFSFFRVDFTVFTARSTSPFVCGNFGLVVLWWNPHSLANWANSAELNCGPLSDLAICLWEF